MKESTKIPDSRMNKIFGRRYIQNCVWVPWGVLTILLVATRLDESTKLIAWGIVCAIVLSNVIYIIYCLMIYAISKHKKRTPNI